MFTNQFISFPTRLYNRKKQEEIENLGVPGIEYDAPESVFKFNPNDLSAYYPTSQDDEATQSDELNCTMIVLRYGESAELLVTIKEFEQKLNEFIDNIR